MFRPLPTTRRVRQVWGPPRQPCARSTRCTSYPLRRAQVWLGSSSMRSWRHGRMWRCPRDRKGRLPAHGAVPDRERLLNMPSPAGLGAIPSFRLDGKRALVTGAGRGIGLAAAGALADAGAHVTLAARTAREVEEAAQAIRKRGQQADALVLDVSNLAAMQKTIASAAPFNILVNNA